MKNASWLLVFLVAACGDSTIGGGDAGAVPDASARGVVELETAGAFTLLAQSHLATAPTSTITGDVGVSPAAENFITGFELAMDASNVYATSPRVIGRVLAANYASPTPTDLACATLDMQRAYRDAAGRLPMVRDRGDGELGGLALVPGTYAWGTDVLVSTDLTLVGSPTDVWIFQVAGDLTIRDGTQVVLAGGAAANHVFWQASGLVDVGARARVAGTFLGRTSIALQRGAEVDGRVFAQGAIALAEDTVVASKPW